MHDVDFLFIQHLLVVEIFFDVVVAVQLRRIYVAKCNYVFTLPFQNVVMNLSDNAQPYNCRFHIFSFFATIEYHHFAPKSTTEYRKT